MVNYDKNTGTPKIVQLPRALHYYTIIGQYFLKLDLEYSNTAAIAFLSSTAVR